MRLGILGTPANKISLCAAITILVSASVYGTIAPLIMASFADFFGINEAQLGNLVAVYMLSFTVSATSGYLWLKYGRWRLVLKAASLALIVSFIIPLIMPTHQVLFYCHMASGIVSGAIVAPAITRVLSADQPESAFAVVV